MTRFEQNLDRLYKALKEPPDHLVWKRFCQKIRPGPASFCWEWIGRRSHGYGRFSLERKDRPAHRIVMEWKHGHITDELVVDHFVCDNRACVNPRHLRIVSKKENVLRSNSATGIESRKTHCSKGHPLSDNNVRKDGKGRRCVTCKKEHNKNYAAKRPRLNGKRAPVELSKADTNTLKAEPFASVRASMKNGPADKDWLRFINNVRVCSSTNCWFFALSKIQGYGQFSWKGRTYKPHRLVRIWLDGSIPTSYHVHHKCYRPDCVNPNHLQSVPPKMNVLDSANSLAGQNSRKLFCPQGHPYEGSNLMINSEGRRVCRTCHNQRSRDYPAEKKRANALKHYYKRMQDPEFKEMQRQKSANVRAAKKLKGHLSNGS